MSSREIQRLRRKILPILRRYRTRRAGLFGSCLRKNLKSVGDVDVLVDLREEMSLLDVIGMKQDLEEALGKKVDLVEYSTIKPVLRERILQSHVMIL